MYRYYQLRCTESLLFSSAARFKGVNLAPKEKVGNFCFLKISRMSCISTSAARFYGFSSNEVRFKGVRARPVGGAGAHAPEEVHLLQP